MKIYLCGNFQGSERESKREREGGGNAQTHTITHGLIREKEKIQRGKNMKKKLNIERKRYPGYPVSKLIHYRYRFKFFPERFNRDLGVRL